MPFAIFAVLSDVLVAGSLCVLLYQGRTTYTKYVDSPFRLPVPDVSSEPIQSSPHSLFIPSTDVC